MSRQRTRPRTRPARERAGRQEVAHPGTAPAWRSRARRAYYRPGRAHDRHPQARTQWICRETDAILGSLLLEW
jgi:hypothetical protein